MLYQDEIIYIKKNLQQTNKQLLQYINELRPRPITLSCLQMSMHRLEIRRGKQERKWSKREERILKENYRTKGNKEISEMLVKDLKRKRKFTEITVANKLRIMNLHRSADELKLIVERNRANGCYKVPERDKLPLGSEAIKMGMPFIKTETGWISKARHVWIENYGAIPEGKIIYHVDKNPFNNELENLICITRLEERRLNMEKFYNDKGHRLEVHLLATKRKRDAAKKSGDNEVVAAKEKLIIRQTKKLDKYYQTQQSL